MSREDLYNFVIGIAQDGPYSESTIKEIRKDVTGCGDLLLAYVGNITIRARKLIDYDIKEEE